MKPCSFRTVTASAATNDRDIHQNDDEIAYFDGKSGEEINEDKT